MKLIARMMLGLLMAACLMATGLLSRPVAAQNRGEGPAAASTSLPFLPEIVPFTTVPSNGDVNPYGVAYVPTGFHAGGPLNAGDILVSNFNNSNNLQGTGTTIVRIQPTTGQSSLFYQSAVNGLSTALGIVEQQFIIVGNVPTQDGTCGTIGTGSLQVINNKGQLVQTITDPLLDSPWDMTIFQVNSSEVIMFVSNVVSGTVARLDATVHKGGLVITNKAQVASGYGHSCSSATFVLGPTGLVYNNTNDTLYVASTFDNSVFAVESASKLSQSEGAGNMIYSDQTHLHGPLVLLQAPNGDLLVSNGDFVNPDPNQPSEIVEFTTDGTFVSEFSIDPNEGGAFGMKIETLGNTLFRFSAVDDNTATLKTWIVSQ
ncbi:MAG TPA: hypothetical protein VI756_26275 [Blastocatellia bacterium]